MKRPTPFDLTDAVRLYAEIGSVEKVAKALHTSPPFIRVALCAEGVEIRCSREAIAKRVDARRQLVARHFAELGAAKPIAPLVGVSGWTACRDAQALGLKRKRSVARQARLDRAARRRAMNAERVSDTPRPPRWDDGLPDENDISWAR